MASLDPVGLLDPLDARVLLALDDDPDSTVLALAHRLGVARNTVQARLRRLREAGVVRDYSRRVDPTVIGYPLLAFAFVELSQTDGQEAITGLAALPEVLEIHATTGDADLLVKVVARDTADLHRLTGAILGVRGVVRTKTTVSLIQAMPLRVRPLIERSAGTT